MGRFLREFKQKRILGVKCPSCGRTFVPPRQMCGRCHTETCEWVELKDTGTLLYYDIVYYEFIDPTTGEKKPVPWVHGPIQLDGSDAIIDHFLEETNPKKLRSGMRVQAVWREEERIGDLTDIICFRTIEE